uniref:Uncharacterized protein n=1 Tax=Setaria viridis TaxID=4556 RepID=A0A4U6WPU4_SETVI|nr:hypothetical protein SEVIR_1G270100v2 [Setaria viridis]
MLFCVNYIGTSIDTSGTIDRSNKPELPSHERMQQK